MTSVTQQKADLRDIIHSIVMDKYDSTDAEECRAITTGLLFRLMQHMTLQELQAWYRSSAHSIWREALKAQNGS